VNPLLEKIEEPPLLQDGVFTCPHCQASHTRGPVNGLDVYRCFNCGNSTRVPKVPAPVSPFPDFSRSQLQLMRVALFDPELARRLKTLLDQLDEADFIAANETIKECQSVWANVCIIHGRES
jgi:hypothetical protein